MESAMNVARRVRIYFLGSGKIAVPVLDRVAHSGRLDLIGAGTQIDRPAGRKRHLQPTPVGQWGSESGIAVTRIPSVNDPAFLDGLRALSPDFLLVVSFGQLLKEAVLGIPRVCCLNVHASLLPAYRGASPIVSAILNGDEKTGISFMKMERGLDTGPVYRQVECPIPPEIANDELETRLGFLAAEHVEDTICGIAAGRLPPVPQDDSSATLARKIRKFEGLVTFSESCFSIARAIRAYHPWPGVFFYVESGGQIQMLKLNEVEILPDSCGMAGEVLEADKNGWIVACSKGALKIVRVTPQGRKEMTGVEFLRGHPISKGAIIGRGEKSS
jgi:methionyl-tRNA formyltransferase